MWKIYLCGHDEKRQEAANWQEQLKQVFKNKYLILETDGALIDLQKKLESGTPKSVSLDQYTSSSPHKTIVLSRLSKIKEADLVIANASMPSFETTLQLFYSHLLRKPIILFVDHEILEREITYIPLMADMFFQSYDELVKYLQEMKTLPFPKHSLLRDTLLRGLQEEVARIFFWEDRKDALFRAAILTTQLGQLLHYLTHDRGINPAARSIGSRADEEAQLGDSLIQLLIYSISRGFNIDDVYSIGVKRMEEAVWRSRQPEIAPRELRPNEIGYGISASSGEVTGRVVVIRTMDDVSKIGEGKCIVAIPEYQKPIWDEIAARIENVIGLISGTGTPNIHPAIISRELKKPCIVGAKDLVAQLNDGEVVKMIVGTEIDNNSVVRLDSA